MPILKALTVNKRRELIKLKNLCMNCLKEGHNFACCLSKNRCYVCNGKLFTALHTDKLSSSSKNSETNVCFPKGNTINSNSGEIVGANHVSNNINKHINVSVNNGLVLTGTAKVTLQSHNGMKMVVRALIDPTAPRSFITKHVANTLFLKTQKSEVSIGGFEGCVSANSCEGTLLIIQYNCN